MLFQDNLAIMHQELEISMKMVFFISQPIVIDIARNNL